MFNVIDAIEKKGSFPSLGKKEKFPLCFVSAAEAGWPDVSGGSFVEDNLAPAWLKKYLGAKRLVEARLNSSSKIRAAIFRPSLIWDFTKVRKFMICMKHVHAIQIFYFSHNLYFSCSLMCFQSFLFSTLRVQ